MAVETLKSVRIAFDTLRSIDGQKQEGTIESQVAELKRQITAAGHLPRAVPLRLAGLGPYPGRRLRHVVEPFSQPLRRQPLDHLVAELRQYECPDAAARVGAALLMVVEVVEITLNRVAHRQ